MLDRPARDTKETINAWMFDQTHGVVQSGPFAGMQILPDAGWKDNSLSAMLLGCFEEELHGALEQEIARLSQLPNPKIVNVGCSEGYYAIGLARRLPHATVWAVDSCEESLRIAARAADANGVSSQIIVGDDLNVVFAAPDLIVMDCEGAEVAYLDLDRFPSLREATVIVETHNWPNQPRADETIYNRFEPSHFVDQVVEGSRNPNRHELLIAETSSVRWAAVCEHRPCFMSWFVMRPRRAPPAVTALRSCGGCNLCCKLEKIVEINKPSNTMCGDCDVGVGCRIYDHRPRTCRGFHCLWLTATDMPDTLRPDRIGLYAAGNPADGYLRVCVDPDRADAWLSDEGQAVLDRVTSNGLHAVVHSQRQINFVQGEGKPMPHKILLDWTP